MLRCMKKLLLGFFLLFTTNSIFGQQTNTYTDSEKLFYEGKALYAQKKFAASTICFENYLKTADKKESETVQESEYYLAANAYELRKDIAIFKLKNYLHDYPYTPFYNQLCFMLGTA